MVNRGGYQVIPAEKGEPFVDKDPAKRELNEKHWANFLECIKTRQKPIAEIETTVRTSIACILSNLAMRSNQTLDWDDAAKTVKQKDARKLLEYHYRAPWKLEV